MRSPERGSGIGFRDARDYRRARELLGHAGYTDASLAEAVGDDTALEEGAAGLALTRAERGSPLESLILLFMIGAPVEIDSARRALSPMDLAAWADAGLLRVESGSMHPCVMLIPFRDLWIACDLRQRRDQADYVMGLGRTTRRLIDVAVRHPVRAALDMGGGGILALAASKHAERVVASDTSSRAVSFARFNARLNDLGNVEVREGNLFEPAGNETFDLILSNPPDVISPETTFICRDGGMPGDSLAREVIRKAPDHLEPGGFCQIQCNWGHHEGEDWKDRVAGWLRDTGCDAWVLRTATEEPAAYASRWILQTRTREPGPFAQALRKWLDHYEEQGIEAISTGVITMRKSPGPSSWLRIDEHPPAIVGACGDEIDLIFQLRDFLETIRDDRQLLGMKLQISPVVRMSHEFSTSPDAWVIERIRIVREQGLSIMAEVDPYTAGLVGRCNGQRTLGALIDELAELLGSDAGEVAEPMVDNVRRMIENAFLLPEGIFG